MRQWIAAHFAWLAPYLRADTVQSSARLCALLLTVTGCLVALMAIPAAVVLALLDKPVVGALLTGAVGLVGCVVGSGAVAIFARKAMAEAPNA